MTIWGNTPLLQAHKLLWRTLSQLDGMNITMTTSLSKKPEKYQTTMVAFCQHTLLIRMHNSLFKTSSRLHGTALSSILLSQQRYLSLGSRIQQSISLIPKDHRLIFPLMKSMLWEMKKTTANGTAGYSLLITMD